MVPVTIVKNDSWPDEVKCRWWFQLCDQFIYLIFAEKSYRMREILLIGISLSLIARAMISDSYKFTFASPLPEDYRISILLDPCRLLAYNCCVNAFGKSQNDNTTNIKIQFFGIVIAPARALNGFHPNIIHVYLNPFNILANRAIDLSKCNVISLCDTFSLVQYVVP